MTDSGDEGVGENQASAVENAESARNLKEREMEIESLKLQVELEKLKLAQMQMRSNSGDRDQREQNTMGDYAKDLRAVLTKMPDTESLVPAWFKNVDTLLASLKIPEEVQGAVILPFLNEKMRTFSASQSSGQIMPYAELKTKILRELKMTANEYRRLFYAARREEGESWAQFTTKLETFSLYYLSSREIKTIDELKELIIADRVKQVMPDE
ncbi:hypothetical protein HPB47_016529, partial [Ixodes persulcatus]